MVKAERIKVALAQVLPGVDIEALFAQAAAESADVIVFPEMFSNGYRRYDTTPSGRAAWIDAAESIDGAFVERFRQAAQRYRIAAVVTLLERGEEKPFNTALLIDRQGQTVLQQRKRHICFFDNPEDACAAGERSDVAELVTAHGSMTVGLMICMDREFPDVATDLMRAGAEIILVPNSCALVDDPEIGDVRLAGIRATAYQTVTCMAVANYPETKDDGHSVAVDELGKVVGMGTPEAGLVFAEFDLAKVRETQKQEWFRRKR
ncbi:carbon-nitrogen hydrolase family protein [Allorhizobium sp. NPDC080224]|uniref:carbon-nitrogen hydrolase family protein n=1 Tax=Allorhizobium sp. NPDC080224 TaxID=3390547 RepID=UPI003D028CE0